MEKKKFPDDFRVLCRTISNQICLRQQEISLIQRQKISLSRHKSIGIQDQGEIRSRNEVVDIMGVPGIRIRKRKKLTPRDTEAMKMRNKK